MNCPKCGDADVFTVDSRPQSDTVRRRRVCSKCRHRWSTLEIAEKEYKAIAALKSSVRFLCGLEEEYDD